MPYYTRALRIADEYDYQLEKADAIRHIGNLAAATGDFKQVQHCFETYLALLEAQSLPVRLPCAHLALGEIYHAQNELDAAEKHYQRARELAETMQITTILFFTSLCFGYLHQDRGELALAREHMQSALALAQAIDLKRDVMEAQQALEEVIQQQTASQE